MRQPYSGIRSGIPNPVVCGRKYCSLCGRWRLVAIDFDVQRGSDRPPRFRSWCRTCQRVYNRNTLAKRTERQRELYREYQRFWTEVRRRQQGVAPRAVRRQLPVERVFLSPTPLLIAMNRWANAQSNPSWKVLATRAGLQPRAIWRLQHGESQHVRIDVADKLAIAMGVPLSLIYLDEREA